MNVRVLVNSRSSQGSYTSGASGILTPVISIYLLSIAKDPSGRNRQTGRINLFSFFLKGIFLGNLALYWLSVLEGLSTLLGTVFVHTHLYVLRLSCTCSLSAFHGVHKISLYQHPGHTYQIDTFPKI